MAELLDGVEAPKTGEISYQKVIEILERKNISRNTLLYLKELLNTRSILDKSGYSGTSTIIVPKRGQLSGYCIKFSENSLEEEKILLNLFNRYGLTSRVIDYIRDSEDILITESIDYPLALESISDYIELAKFMGKTLRNFHDIKWEKELTQEEQKVLENHGKRIITNSLEHSEGLEYMAAYQEDYDYNRMLEYIRENKEDYQLDVIIHGDFNPRNVFAYKGNFMGFIDVTDAGYGDRHYDIFWTMWTIALYSGILANKEKVQECERNFLESYGYDMINEKRLTLSKKLNCMYWQPNNNIKYFNE